jgi:glutathione peroxidase-family protein
MKSMEEDPGLRQLKDYLSDFVVSNIDNSDVRTAYDWLGDRATLVVNVASECGLTD